MRRRLGLSPEFGQLQPTHEAAGESSQSSSGSLAGTNGGACGSPRPASHDPAPGARKKSAAGSGDDFSAT